MKIRRTIPMLTLAVYALTPVIAQNRGGAERLSTLTVEKIMRDPVQWIGTSPSRLRWSEDGRKLYFQWNPEKTESDSMYAVSYRGGDPVKVSREEREALPGRWGDVNRDRTLKVFERDGDLFLMDIRQGTERQITNTVERESNPVFTHDEKKIAYVRDNNLYLWQMDSGVIAQVTNFTTARDRRSGEERKSEQEKWVEAQELKLMEVIKARKERDERRRKAREEAQPDRPKAIRLGEKRVQGIMISPDERFVTFRLSQQPRNVKRTIVPNYVHESGYTQDIPARTMVGTPQSTYELGIYDIERDTVLYVSTKDIPGIYDEPAYLAEYSKDEAQKDAAQKDAAEEKPRSRAKDKRKPREVMFNGPVWSDDGAHAAMMLMAQDGKDKWIVLLQPDSAKLVLLYRQRDEAWIGGPGMWIYGWMPDNRHVWFSSEETGYSHLYSVDVYSGEKRALTRGEFEVSGAQVSRDKKTFYFTSNEVHPGEKHFYRMPIDGGQAVKITTMPGNNEVTLSPDERTLAIRHSYSNRPWELYIMPNKPGAKPSQVTRSLSDEFRSYPWRDPEIVTFRARDGAEVYARLYRPANAESGGPAVIFVHGAGYLQNVHRWWSSYFREYMFHNLLADNGYTVLDIDYRGSAGYGRDWRTAIYRHMCGKDLTDQVDGARFLVESYGVSPERIGIYGGSYGGLITLMAMFKHGDVFRAGAALRAVTDYSHYNHWYTSRILNTPTADSLAYIRSSPIHFAEGLEGALLICHGMIDTNVHFQDVVRLAQRLIELGKENWELAVYPVEGHGFREPSSWTDEYRRIFKLFEENLKDGER